MNQLIFTLSASEYLKIITQYNLNLNELDYCCDELIIYFCNDQLELCIGQDSARELFEHFITRFKRAIHNQLQLHESLTQNLGFMENEYYYNYPHNKSKFFTISSPSGQSKYWIGHNYEIWSVSGNANPHVGTWLYNNNNNEIILEITPSYKWHFMEFEDDPENIPNFITYDEFMKNYQPILQRVIPRHVAIQWLDQAMKIYKTFFETEEKYLSACKENGWENF